MASWKLVLGEQIGSWGCKGKIFRGGNTYEITDPEVIQAAARVKFVTVLPGDADVEAWKAEQVAAAVAVAAPEPETPEEDYVAETGEVAPEDEASEMDMVAQLNAALNGEDEAPVVTEPEAPVTEPEVPEPAKKPATKKPKSKRKSRAKKPAS